MAAKDNQSVIVLFSQVVNLSFKFSVYHTQGFKFNLRTIVVHFQLQEANAAFLTIKRGVITCWNITMASSSIITLKGKANHLLQTHQHAQEKGKAIVEVAKYSAAENKNPIGLESSAL